MTQIQLLDVEEQFYSPISLQLIEVCDNALEFAIRTEFHPSEAVLFSGNTRDKLILLKPFTDKSFDIHLQAPFKAKPHLQFGFCKSQIKFDEKLTSFVTMNGGIRTLSFNNRESAIGRRREPGVKFSVRDLSWISAAQKFCRQ